MPSIKMIRLLLISDPAK